MYTVLDGPLSLIPKRSSKVTVCVFFVDFVTHDAKEMVKSLFSLVKLERPVLVLVRDDFSFTKKS